MGKCHDTLIISNAIEPGVGGGLGGYSQGARILTPTKYFQKLICFCPEFDRKHILV